MNNEFQWRSGMRKLDEKVEPATELWPAIAARIESEAAIVPMRPRAAWPRFAAIAATLVIASGAALVAYRQADNVDVVASTPAKAPAGVSFNTPRTALDWAVPADPKLAAAAQDLDKASVDLQAALEAHPDAVFLVSMINRTNAQRMRLMRQSAISG